MSTFPSICFTLSTSALLVAGCAHAPRQTGPSSATDTKPVGASLSTAEAIRIAKQAAQRQGVQLHDFKEPKAQFTSKDHSWWLLFDGQVPMPGNHFVVSIDDPTGNTRFFPGR